MIMSSSIELNSFNHDKNSSISNADTKFTILNSKKNSYFNLNERIKNNINKSKNNNVRHYNILNGIKTNFNSNNINNTDSQFCKVLKVEKKNNINNSSNNENDTNSNNIVKLKVNSSLFKKSAITQNSSSSTVSASQNDPPKRKLSVALSNFVGIGNAGNNGQGNYTLGIINPNSNLNNSFLNLHETNIDDFYNNGNKSNNNQNKRLYCCYICCWLIKYCINSNNVNIGLTNASQLNSNQNNNEKIQSFNVYFKKILVKLKVNIFGIVVSLIVCLSFVVMTYLLRRTFNLIEFYDSKYLSIASNSTKLNFDNKLHEKNIEIDSNNILLSCDLCYLMVWTSTSCLFLVYPVFFIINYLILNNHKSLKNTPTIVTNKTSNDINQQISSSLNKNDSEISNIKEIKLIDIIKDSFDLFSAKKNKLQSNISTTSTTSTFDNSFNNSTSTIKLSKQFFFKISLITAVWIITAYSFLRAIDLLYCSDLVLLFSVNFSFVYMATWIILHQLFIPLRLFGFILSIAAIIFTYYSEGFVFNLKFFGNFLATMSAAGSAVIQIVWNDTTKNKSNNQRCMLLTLIGLFNFLFGWPILILLYFTGIENISFSTSSATSELFNSELKNQIVMNLVIASILAFVYIFLIKFGFLITSEIYLRVGCLLTIPASVVIDVKFNDLDVADLKIGAILFICVGYLFLLLPENLYQDFKQHFCPEPEQIETYSLTRRYKYSSPVSPSPTLVQKQQIRK